AIGPCEPRQGCIGIVADLLEYDPLTLPIKIQYALKLFVPSFCDQDPKRQCEQYFVWNENQILHPDQLRSQRFQEQAIQLKRALDINWWQDPCASCWNEACAQFLHERHNLGPRHGNITV